MAPYLSNSCGGTPRGKASSRPMSSRSGVYQKRIALCSGDLSPPKKDNIPLLVRSAENQKASRSQRGDIRLLCQVVAESTGMSRAAGVPGVGLAVQVVLEGIWPLSKPAVFAARTWRSGIWQPALVIVNDTAILKCSMDLFLLSDKPDDLSDRKSAAGDLHGDDTLSVFSASTVKDCRDFQGTGQVVDAKAEHVLLVELVKSLRPIDAYCTNPRSQLEYDAEAVKSLLGKIAQPMPREAWNVTPNYESLASTRRPKSRSEVHSPLPGVRGSRPSSSLGHHKKIDSESLTRRPASSAGQSVQDFFHKLHTNSVKRDKELAKTVPVEHIDCLALPPPLDRIFLLLPPQNRMGQRSIELIANSEHPAVTFASLLMSRSTIDLHHDLKKHFHAGVLTHLQFCPSNHLAAMAALFWDVARRVQLGPLERPEEDLKMLQVFTKLESLTYTDPKAANLSGLAGIQKMEHLDVHDMGNCLTDLSNFNPPSLKHIKLSKCNGLSSGASLPRVDSLQTLLIERCGGLRNLNGMESQSVPSQKCVVTECHALESIEGLKGKTLCPELEFCFNRELSAGVADAAACDGLIWLDLQGCGNIDPKTLLPGARAMKERVGEACLVWPNDECMRAAGVSETNYSQKRKSTGKRSRHGTRKALIIGDNSIAANQAEILGIAAQAAQNKLDRARQQVRNIMSNQANSQAGNEREAIEQLGEALRHMKEMGASGEDIDSVKQDIMKLRIHQFQAENPESVQVLKEMGDTSPGNKFKRGIAKIKFLKLRSARTLRIEQGVPVLLDLGFSQVEAETILKYCDAEQKGFINEHDMLLVFERGNVATTEEMMEFYVWLMKRFDTIAEAWKAICAFSPWCDSKVTIVEWEHALSKLEWNRDNVLGLFMALDSDRRSGTLDADEFALLNFFTSIHSIRIAEALREAFIQKYGSLEEAFIEIDDNRSGQITMDELRRAITSNATQERMNKALPFIDQDLSGVLSKAEFLGWKDLSANQFLKDVMAFRDQLILRFKTMQTAFNTMEAVGQKDGKLTRKEFSEGCKKFLKINEFSNVDPRTLYHFLDVSQDGTVQKEEFVRLCIFNADAASNMIGRCREKLMKLYKNDGAQAFNKICATADRKAKFGDAESSKTPSTSGSPQKTTKAASPQIASEEEGAG